MDRRARVDFHNYSNVEYELGGEFFDSGGWANSKYKERRIPRRGPAAAAGGGSSSSSQPPAPPVLTGNSPARGSTAPPPTTSSATPTSGGAGAGQCSIACVNNSFVAGVGGYVYYVGNDGSCIEIAFSNPMIGPNRFTARRHASFTGNAKVQNKYKLLLSSLAA